MEVWPKGVRPRTIRFIIGAGGILIFAAFFLGEGGVHKKIWAEAAPVLKDLGGYQSAYTWPEWMALITPLIMLVTAGVAHWRDECSEGRGIKDILLREVVDEPYNLKTEVIGASMTKQSVLAAIAAVLVAVIQIYPKETPYGLLVKFLATVGFAFAILFLLVSMICYDYACRFRWPSSHYTSELVRKALLLDVMSWYFLLTSFVLTVALRSPRLSVVTCVVAGCLMWWYYFFPWRGLTVGVKDLTTSKEFYRDKLGLKVNKEEDARVSLRIGVWTEIVLVKTEEAKHVPLRFRLTMSRHNLLLVAKSAIEGEVVEAPAEGAAAYGWRRPLTFTDPDNHTLVFRARWWTLRPAASRTSGR